MNGTVPDILSATQEDYVMLLFCPCFISEGEKKGWFQLASNTDRPTLVARSIANTLSMNFKGYF